MFRKKPATENESYREIFMLVRNQLALLDEAREKWPTVRMKARGARDETQIDEMLRKVLVLKLDAGCPETEVLKRLVGDLDRFVQDSADWKDVDIAQKEYVQEMLVRMFG